MRRRCPPCRGEGGCGGAQAHLFPAHFFFSGASWYGRYGRYGTLGYGMYGMCVRSGYGTYVLDGIAVLAVRYVLMDEHTRIWSEPLSDSERWIIKALCADPARGDTGKWMRHLLTCYDALAVRAEELEQEVRNYQRQSSEQADEAIGWREKHRNSERDWRIERLRAERAKQERNEARVARDLLVEVNDEVLGRIKRAEAVLRDIAEGHWNTGSRTLDVPAPPYRDAREYARAYFGGQP
jgi:hypothetical protein